MKGRIIGREGRNIRRVRKRDRGRRHRGLHTRRRIVSAFDNVRREVAKLSIMKLIQDERIHPSRIEEIVRETQQEMNEPHPPAWDLRPHRKRAFPASRENHRTHGLSSNFRVSYSQNVRRHSIEVAYLNGAVGRTVGPRCALARRCGFLHDIGKAADHEMRGATPAVGAEPLKRYGEPS